MKKFISLSYWLSLLSLLQLPLAFGKPHEHNATSETGGPVTHEIAIATKDICGENVELMREP